jgi:hypothetical protein
MIESNQAGTRDEQIEVLVRNVEGMLRDTREPHAVQDAILEQLKRHHQRKRLDVRVVKDLNAAIPGQEIRLVKGFGTTYLEWGGYGRSQGREGGSLTVAHRTTNLTVDVSFIEAQNEAYFGALRARNARRDEALSEARQGERRALAEAIHQYNEAVATLTRLTAYNTPLGEIRYQVQACLATL